MKIYPKREGIMLAYPADQGRINRLGEYYLIQTKINGERARLEWFDGDPVFLSSYANIFPFLKPQKEELKWIAQQIGSEVLFDGEIYVHGWSRERIASALASDVNFNPDNDLLEFHIFDIQTDAPQITRSALLSQLVAKYQTDHIKIVPTYKASGDDWLLAADRFVDDGYEGVILRHTDGIWTPKRTVHMLKYKPTEEDEYKILKINEAFSKEGYPKGMAGSFTVASEFDQRPIQFDVGAGKLTHKERREIWVNRGELIGKMLITKHEKGKTSHGVPLCCAAVKIKEE